MKKSNAELENILEMVHKTIENGGTIKKTPRKRIKVKKSMDVCPCTSSDNGRAHTMNLKRIAWEACNSAKKEERTPVGVIIAVMGGRLTLTWKDYLDRGQSFTIITKIYK